MEQNVNIVKLTPTAIIPTSGSMFAAGYDLYADVQTEITIAPGETEKIPTGLAMGLPINTAMFIYARSGLATKEGLRPANCVGVCDADYTGEYMVALYNDSNKPRIVKPGDRIAQAVLQPHYTCNFIQVDKLDQTDRGSGGFGSTGR